MRFKLVHILILSFLILPFKLTGQVDNSYPSSSLIFNPFVFNPGMIGNKEYSVIGFNTRLNGNQPSQVAFFNVRLHKTQKKYLNASPDRKFTRIGVGASILHSEVYTHQNFLFNGAMAYHLPLNQTKLSFLSIGAGAKMSYSLPGNEFSPLADFGIYYYNPFFDFGLSYFNIVQIQNPTDSTSEVMTRKIPNYRISGGYRFILNRRANIVFEPGILLNLSDSAIKDPLSDFTPFLKMYMQNFCVGTTFTDLKAFSFFFQFKFPIVYLGTYITFPKNQIYLKNGTPIFELTLGLNLPKQRELSRW